MKKILSILIVGLLLPIGLMAQTGSPSSRFGYGEMSDGVPGEYRALGGVVTAMRSSHAINPSQPASYTAGDSLSFMFNVAAGLGWTNYKDAKGQRNKAMGSLEYVTLQFPIWKRWIAFSAGIMPFTLVKYDFALAGQAGDNPYTVTYSGQGGLSQIYAGLGFNVLDWFAAGANFYYVFGTVQNYTDLTFGAASGANPSQIVRYMDMRACRAKVGAQLFHTFGKHSINLGATFDPKLKMGGTYYVAEVMSLDTLPMYSGSEMPMAWSVGASYCWNNRLTVAADYSVQNWSDASYFGQVGFLQDRQKVSVGCQYRHNPFGMKYEERMIWRLGVAVMNSYTTGDDWQDFTLSLGFGFPLRTTATMINTTIEYGHKRSLGGLNENILKLTLDVAVNEMWFHKRKL